jgi:hypothetical protein
LLIYIYIGGAAVPLYQVFQQGHVDNWFNITRPSGMPAGEIHLSMNFKNQVREILESKIREFSMYNSLK